MTNKYEKRHPYTISYEMIDIFISQNKALWRLESHGNKNIDEIGSCWLFKVLKTAASSYEKYWERSINFTSIFINQFSCDFLCEWKRSDMLFSYAEAYALVYMGHGAGLPWICTSVDVSMKFYDDDSKRTTITNDPATRVNLCWKVLSFNERGDFIINASAS